MSTENSAVFLSYASQDAEAAKKICEALRTAGVEVCFDQNELVGGWKNPKTNRGVCVVRAGNLGRDAIAA